MRVTEFHVGRRRGDGVADPAWEAATRIGGRGLVGRVDIRAILADPGKRRRLLVGAILALQHREGIPTTVAQATNAYDRMRRRFMGRDRRGEGEQVLEGRRRSFRLASHVRGRQGYRGRALRSRPPVPFQDHIVLVDEDGLIEIVARIRRVIASTCPSGCCFALRSYGVRSAGSGHSTLTLNLLPR